MRCLYLLLLLGVGASDVHGQWSPVDRDRITSMADSLDPLNSIIVWHRGSVVIEDYFRGMRADRAVNVKSASKTLLSPLVGIAIQEGHLDGVEQTIADLLPGRIPPDDSLRRTITLRHALTMRTGLETTSFNNYGAWASSSDWVRFQLEQPFECDPGQCWTYSTGTSHLVSAILTRATGESLLSFARSRFFGPLGIRLSGWDRDPQGVYLGGNNMALRPRDLLRVGQLFLNGGRWNGQQLVPEAWIRESWGTYGQSTWNRNRYGYFWWSREFAGEDTWFAWGYGGQYLFLVPRLDLIVVITSSLTDRPPGSGRHNRRLYAFLRETIIPSARRSGPTFARPAR